MKISLNWLKDFLEYKETDVKKMAELLSESTSEVEEIIQQGKGLEKIYVGEILEITPHPDADRMQVTKTKVGDEIFQIVCGAKNIRTGQKVPVALVGAVLPGDFEIKKADKRGVESCGMICSEVELGLADESAGIMELKNDAPLGMEITEYLGLDDTVFDIENTTITNRPDLFSHIGYAKEFVALGLAKWKGGKTINLDSQFQDILKDIPEESFPLNLKIEKADIAPHVCCIAIENFKVQESPNWMKKRLIACGIRPINNLVDITNYVMLELGMPLHAFDLDMIDGKNVKMRTSKKGEKVITLDGIERELPENVIILEDEKKIFDLCGIMGGENSGIRNETKNVWIHSPVYDPIRIRRASVALSHRTDASIIYEKRVPSSMAIRGVLRALQLSKELCPECIIASKILDINNDQEEEKTINLRKEKLNRVMGEILEEKFVTNVLTNLGFEIENKKDSYELKIPDFRFKDINIEEDIIEEIARIYGLNKLSPELPSMKMSLSKPALGVRVEQKVKNVLAESAYEVLNYSFLGEKLLEKCNFKNKDKLIEISNPLSEDIRFMRPALLPYVLKNIEANYKYNEKIALFEIGKIFGKDLDLYEQKNLIYIAYNSSFYEVKGILENLFEKLNLKVDIKPSEKDSIYAHAGQNAEIFFQGKFIGYLSRLHPRISKNFDLIKPVVFFEIDFKVVQETKLKLPQFCNINKLPTVERDQNFVLDKKVLVGDLTKKIGKGIPFLKNLEISDVYEGDQVEKGMKSITFKAVYQAEDKTLTDEEVDTSHKKLVEQGVKNGARLR